MPLSIVMDDFLDVRTFDDIVYPVIAVYKYPEDFPDKFVARIYLRGGKATPYVMIKESLEEIFRGIPMGFTYLPPTKLDVSSLVGTFV